MRFGAKWRSRRECVVAMAYGSRMRVLRLTELQRATHSISASCAIDDLRFHFTIWYQDIDLDHLARIHGEDLLERIAFHIALFQLTAVASLKPDVIDLGRWSRF